MIEPIIYVLIAGALLVLAVWRPGTAIAAVMCLYGLEQWGQSYIRLLIRYSAFTNYFVAFVVLAAVFMKFYRGQTIFRGYPLVAWLSLALFSFAMVSVLWAPREDLTLKQLDLGWPYYATFVLLAPFILYEMEDFDDGLVALLFCGAVLTVLSLYIARWELRGIVLGGKYMGNPLAIAQMAGNVMIVAMLMPFRKKEKTWVILRWVITVLCLSLIVKTSSRGQLLAAVISIAIFWLYGQKKINIKKLFKWVMITAVLIALVWWALQGVLFKDRRWTSIGALRDVAGRLDLAFILLQHWWQGGLFTFLFGLGNSASFDPRILGYYPHVMPLEVLAEEGVFGFILFSIIMVSSIRSLAHGYILTVGDQDCRKVLSTIGAMFCMAFILSLKQGSYLGSHDLFLLAILIAKYKYALLIRYMEDTQKIFELNSGVKKNQEVRLVRVE